MQFAQLCDKFNPQTITFDITGARVSTPKYIQEGIMWYSKYFSSIGLILDNTKLEFPHLLELLEKNINIDFCSAKNTPALIEARAKIGEISNEKVKQMLLKMLEM